MSKFKDVPSGLTGNEGFAQQGDPTRVQRQPGVSDPWSGESSRYSRTQVTPGGWLEKYLTMAAPISGTTLLEEAAGYPINSVLVDNWTNQWLYIDGVRRFIPPYSGGWVLNAHSGTQVAKVQLVVPPGGQLIAPAAIAGEQVWIGFAEEILPPASGSVLGLGIGASTGTAGIDIFGKGSAAWSPVALLGAGDGVTRFPLASSIVDSAFATAQVGSSSPDNQSSGNTLGVKSQNQLWNNVGWDRARDASATNIAAALGLGATLITPPGYWSVVSTPAAGSQATASRSAGGAGVRHVAACLVISFGTIAAAAATLLQWNLRDGATGAGTVLASGQVAIPAAAFQSDNLVIPLNIPGTAATAMTLEFSAALANLAEGCTLMGYDVS